MADGEPRRDSQEDLIRDKLQLEIQRLRLSWWKRPPYVGAVATIAIALFGFIWAMTSGVLDVRLWELELARKRVEFQTELLKEKRDSLTAENEEITRDLSALRARLRSYGNPIIFDLSVSSASTSVTGLNFGNKQGTVYVKVYWYDAETREIPTTPGEPTIDVPALRRNVVLYRRDTSLETEVISWEDSLVVFRLVDPSRFDSLLSLPSHAANLQIRNAHNRLSDLHALR